MVNMLNKVSMNFNNLTIEGYTAFILAIIFTIICIASFIFYARHKSINKIVLAFMTIVFPFLAIFCWVYLIMNIFEFNLAMSLYISFGASAGYVVLSVCIGLIVAAIVKSKQPKKVIAEETIEKQIDNTQTQTIVTPLLITEEKPVEVEIEKNVEVVNVEPAENIKETETTEETKTEEVENVVEVETASETEPENVVEEISEPTENEVVEENTEVESENIQEESENIQEENVVENSVVDFEESDIVNFEEKDTTTESETEEKE